jgi:hypothetical protein
MYHGHALVKMYHKFRHETLNKAPLEAEVGVQRPPPCRVLLLLPRTTRELASPTTIGQQLASLWCIAHAAGGELRMLPD